MLKAISLDDVYGYGVLLRIEQIPDGAILVQQGALYPALYRLEHRGFTSSTWGTSENSHRAKYYRLTAPGEQETRAQRAGWTRLADAIACALTATPQEVRA